MMRSVINRTPRKGLCSRIGRYPILKDFAPSGLYRNPKQPQRGEIFKHRTTPDVGWQGILLAIFALLISCTTLSAQGADASASLSTNQDRLTVGDQASVVLSIQHDPSQSRVAWPVVPDSFDKLEVVKKDRIDTIKKGRFLIYQQELRVTGFDSGAYTIPPFQVTVTPASGVPYTIQTGAINMLVQTVPVDTTKPFRPIKGIMVVEASWMDYIWLIVAGIIALIAIGLVVYFLRQKKHKIPPPPPPPEPLHIRAMRMLEALEGEQLWQKGEVKAYYIRLTDILRSYIEARFVVPAMERTTDELISVARRHSELALHVDKLYSVLATADMAKFARAQPLPAEHIAAMQSTKDFITASIPVPEPVQHSNIPTLQHSNPTAQP